MKQNNWVQVGLAIYAVLLLFSCKKMNETYLPYIEGGEINYAGKADSLKVLSGNGRVQLSWLYNPKTVRAVIYWNAGSGKHEHVIEPGNKGKWESTIIEGLEEGSYQFDVYTFDYEGNNSVKTSASGSVYGEVYNQSLLNRKTKSAVQAGQDALINWYGAGTGAVAVEVTYKVSSGAIRIIYDPVSKQQTLLQDYLPGSVVSYRTLYLPQNNAIDTFYSQPDNLAVEIKLQSPTPVTTLVGDYNQHFQNRNYNMLFDGNYNDYMGTLLTAPASNLPQSFTLDFHTPTRWTRLRFWMVRGTTAMTYNYCAPEEIEIWGSNELDNDWSKWTKLIDQKVVKPSGTPRGTLTALDIETAEAGIELKFPTNTAAYRYMRWKTKKTFQDLNAVQMCELVIWGF